MISSALVSRYANALADVVTGGKAGARPEEITQQLRDMEAAIAGSRDLRIALASPAIPSSRKKAALGKIAERLSLSRTARNFLFVLIDHRRIDALQDIIDMYETVLDERLGFARADVAAATDLTEAQRAAIVRRLAEMTGKQVRPRYSVDPSLIGGVVARVGSTVFDGSVRGRLRALERRLAAE